MPLRHERPSVEYMRELRAVARSAAMLRDHLPKVNLFPEGFPREQVEGFCKALVRLPDGTAEGSIAPLRAADSELNRIRQRFIPAHDEEAGDAEPLVPRNSDFDLRLVSLTAAVRAAIERYKVESGEELDTDVTPDRPVNPEVEAAKTEAFDDIAVARREIHDAEAAMAAADPAIAAELDNEKRLIVSADINVGSAGATLATESPRPTVLRWLEDNLSSVADEMERIIETHKPKIAGVGKEIGGLAGDLLDIWLPKLTKSLKAVRVRLTNARVIIVGGQDAPLQGPPVDFDYAEVYHRLLRGEKIPGAWAPHITVLDFFFVQSHPLDEDTLKQFFGRGSNFTRTDLLVDFKNLRHLYLGNTKVYDIKPLQNLSKLEYINLMITQIDDLKPLGNLSSLHYLNLRSTRVSDLTPLRNLTNLRHLDITNTQVRDITPLEHLKNLKITGP